MKKGALRIAKVKGIGIWVHWTFLLLLGFIMFQGIRTGDSTTQILGSVFLILIVFVCVVLHELGHALTAMRFNVKTKSIVLLPIGGMANMEKIPENPKQEFAIAIAGPLVNLAIAMLLGLCILLFMKTDLLTQMYMQKLGAEEMVVNVFFINLALFAFNLLPAFPMDGGRILRSIIATKTSRTKATKIASGIGKLFAFAFIIIGFYANLFLILIGVFILFAASAEANYVELEEITKGKKVHQAMRTNYTTLNTNNTITEAKELLLAGADKDFLVVDGEKPKGVLEREKIIQAIEQGKENEPVSNFITKDFKTVQPNQLLTGIHRDLLAGKQKIIPVTEDGILLGILEQENLVEMIMLEKAANKKETIQNKTVKT